MLHSQACDGADSSGQDMNTQWRKLQIVIFSKKCCPNATRRAALLNVRFPSDCDPNSGHRRKSQTCHEETEATNLIFAIGSPRPRSFEGDVNGNSCSLAH